MLPVRPPYAMLPGMVAGMAPMVMPYANGGFAPPPQTAAADGDGVAAADGDGVAAAERGGDGTPMYVAVPARPAERDGGPHAGRDGRGDIPGRASRDGPDEPPLPTAGPAATGASTAKKPPPSRDSGDARAGGALVEAKGVACVRRRAGRASRPGQPKRI